VVGVAADVRYQGVPLSSGLDVYVSYSQHNAGGLYFVMRTAGDAASLGVAARQAVWDVDAEQSIIEVATLAELQENVAWPHPHGAGLLAILAIIGGSSTAFGMWSLTGAYFAGRRVDPTGRIAAAELVRPLLAVLLGLSAGLLGAGLALPYYRAILHESTRAEAATFLGAAVVVALLGSVPLLSRIQRHGRWIQT
jgi:hypothetical protein